MLADALRVGFISVEMKGRLGGVICSGLSVWRGSQGPRRGRREAGWPLWPNVSLKSD